MTAPLLPNVQTLEAEPTDLKQGESVVAIPRQRPFQSVQGERCSSCNAPAELRCERCETPLCRGCAIGDRLEGFLCERCDADRSEEDRQR